MTPRSISGTALLLRRVGKYPRRFSVPGVAGLGLLSAALLGSWLVAQTGFSSSYERLVSLGGALCLIEPVVLACVAYCSAVAIVNYRKSSEYSLLCATLLSNAELAWGFELAALYRCRLVLGLLAGLAPLLAVVFDRGNWTAAYQYIHAPAESDLQLWEVGWLGLRLLATGMYLSTLAAWLALWWRSLAGTLGAVVVVGLGLEGVNWVVQIVFAVSAFPYAQPFKIGLSLLLFGLAGVNVWLATYWVRDR